MRAQLLLSSGVQYASGSMEFRLASLAYAAGNEYKRHYDFLVGDVLLAILTASAIGKASEESRKKCVEQLSSNLERLRGMLSLATVRHESESEKKAREKVHVSAQESYAKTLASLGSFNSVDQLQAAITALNETIRESGN